MKNGKGLLTGGAALLGLGLLLALPVVPTSQAAEVAWWIDRTGTWQVKLKGIKTPVTWTIEDLDVKKSGLDQWGTYNPDDEDSPPAATLFYDYLVILPDHMDLGPSVISMVRSSVRVARKELNTKISTHASNGVPMQALVFEAGSFTDSNSAGEDFKNWTFKSAGFASEELFAKAQEYKGLLETYTVQDEESAVTEGSGAGGYEGTQDADKF